jgi:thiol:disulfide interchange protein
MESPLNANAWTADRLAAARREGPVFVYFTADWCITCKVNESAAINRRETARAFEVGNVTTLVADWTNADADITEELAKNGRNSVPLYLWYPDGGGEPQALPQVLNVTLLVQLASQ